MEKEKLLSRRNLLKLSLASGVAIAAGINGKAIATEHLVAPDKRPGHARQRFLDTMNCAQAIMETYASTLGMSVEDAKRVAAPFARGMGMGSECGAVTGAFMVIGMKYGKTRDDDSKADSETFRRMDQFVEEFKKRHQYIDCSSLLETDMSSKGGILLAKLKGHFKNRCPHFVESAAEILEDILV